eukprot:scaffold15305_cov126-Cylindrotheca_fusiformis.AAC.9
MTSDEVKNGSTKKSASVSGGSSVGSANNNSSKSSKLGRKGDPRMHRAVSARLSNPELSLFEALRVGGFDFPTNDDASVLDSEKVTLGQRKNQLSRRLRLARKQNVDAVGGDGATSNEKSSSGLDSQQGLQRILRQQQRTSKSSNMGALALKMKRDCPDLEALSDDEGDMEAEEQPKRQRIAKFHPDYSPLFVPPSASSRHPFNTGSIPSQNGTTNSASHQTGGSFPANQGAGNFAGINMNAFPFGQPLGAASHFPQGSLFSHQIGNGFNAHQQTHSPARASAVAISSLASSAQAIGMTLEQLAMTLSSNPTTLSKLLVRTNDKDAVEKQEGLALHLYELECKALYARCMLMAGMDPKLCQPESQAHLEFALKAWEAQGRRLQELVRDTKTVRDPPLEVDNEKPNVRGVNSESGTSDAFLHQNQSQNPNADKPENGCLSQIEGRHVHRLDGQCGHKAIIHHPKDGIAHIDFVIGQVVECYHGIETVGKQSVWPSKYKCRDLENCSQKCDSSTVGATDALSKIQPKTIPLSEINMQDPEWNFDVNGSIDGGVTGLFKLGEISDDISTI